MEELSLIQQAQQAINVAERQLEDAVAAARTAARLMGKHRGRARRLAPGRLQTLRLRHQPIHRRNHDSHPPLRTPIAETFIRHIADGDADAATTMIHPQARKQLPWSSIVPVWEALLAEYGAFDRNREVVGVLLSMEATEYPF